MYSIKKRFSSYPFAHRQPRHEGHCKLIHGHNWDFELELESHDGMLDENDFVYDFGKFKTLKEWFTHMFDHTCVINSNDPLLERFKKDHLDGIMELRIVPSGSAEGLARLIFEHCSKNMSFGAARLVSVTVYEDHKNTATYKLG